MNNHPEEGNREHITPSPEPLETFPQSALEHPAGPDFLSGVTVNVLTVNDAGGGHPLSERELEFPFAERGTRIAAPGGGGRQTSQSGSQPDDAGHQG